MMENTFVHCPRCGSTRLQFPEKNHLECEACGFEYYMNSGAATGVLFVKSDGSFLLSRRANNPGKGSWDMPGGFVEFGETAEEAIRREIREELQIEMERLEYFGSFPNEYPYKDVMYHTLDLIFLCRLADDSQMEVTLDPEILELQWFTPETVEMDSIAFPSMRAAVTEYCERWKNGQTAQ
jgi:mutator protein MutT